MKVLATGADGSFAGLVVPALVARGIHVRALVHNPAKADVPRANGAQEVVLGDLRDSDSLDAALKGVDGVFLITPAFAPDATQMGLDVVAAAQRAGVTKIVYSGVYHPSLHLPNHAGTRPIEEALYHAKLAFVVMQPAMFMQGLTGVWQQGLKTGTLVMPWSKQSRMAYVDYRDVADVAATGFAENILDNGTFELAGGGTVTRIELATMMSEAAGRSLTAADMDTPPPHSPAGISEMFRDYDTYGFHGGNDLVLRTILKRKPRTIPAFLDELRSQR